MGKTPTYVLTAILALCIFIQLSSRGASDASRASAFPPILAIGILWTIVLWEGMPGAIKIPAIVVFFLVMLAGAVVPAFQNGAKAVLDRPGTQAPLTLRGQSSGKSSAGSIAIVYHSGGSNAVTTVVTRLGEDLAADGHAVTMLRAGTKLVLDQRKYKAIVLGFPVYAGETRPPVVDFVRANAPFSVPVFAVLSGWFPAMKEQDLGRLSAVVSRASGRLVAGTKIGSGMQAQAMQKELASIESSVQATLERSRP